MKNVIVTTVQKSALPNKGMLTNLKKFIQEHDVTDVFIFITKGKSVYEEVAETQLVGRELHPTQKNGRWKHHGDTKRRVYKVFREVHPQILEIAETGLSGATVHLVHETKHNGIPLNDKLRIYHTQIAPQKANPFYQVNKRMPDKYSYIVPGTKNWQESIGGYNFKARLLTSTGSLTLPSYRTNFSVGNVAQQEHTYGFVFVQVESKKVFHNNLIPVNQKGDFQFEEIVYRNGKSRVASVPGYVVGDVHVDVVDKVALKETKEHIKKLQPKIITLHDVSDSKPINHHEDKNLFAKIARADPKNPDLEKSLKQVLAFLRDMCESFPNSRIDIAESNHDEFLRSYIADQKYETDYRNYVFVLGLIPRFILDRTRKPALQLAMEYISGGDLPKNLKFHSHTDLFSIRGFVTSRHGHKGKNGSRASFSLFLREGIKMIVGHSHSYVYRPTLVQVGHITDLRKQKYAHSGISNWLQANAYIDSLGLVHGKILNSNFGRRNH